LKYWYFKIISNKIYISSKFKAPDSRVNFGSIKGYYIGYKVSDSTDIFIYKTLEVTNKITIETLLKNLNRNTKYDIVLQAFNTKGKICLQNTNVKHIKSNKKLNTENLQKKFIFD
jgi:hypothetical protein